MGIRCGIELIPIKMRTIGRVFTLTLVVVAIGLVSWFVYARITDATLVVFRTGSMSPTMPQGAVAVTHPISAAEIEKGDVVTVRRSDAKLPVTHRVVDVRPAPEGAPPEARELILQGDANATVDAAPYVVTTARRTVVSVPYLGRAIMLIQSRAVMGLLVVCLGGLVTWAFWPRNRAEANFT